MTAVAPRYHTDRAAEQAYQNKYRDQRRRTGQRLTVPADATREYLLLLHSRGYSYQGIAALTGLWPNGLWAIATGRRTRVLASTEDAVRGITLTDCPGPGHLMPSTWVRMLLEVMRRHGYPQAWVADRLGYSNHNRRVEAGRHPFTTYRNHMRVVVLYHLMACQGLVPIEPLRDVPQNLEAIIDTPAP